jgi:hypothetical protein
MRTRRLRSLAGGLALAVAVGACGGGGGWSEETRRDYLNGCRATMGNTAICECSLDALEEAIAEDDLNSTDDARLQSIIVDRCRDELAEFEVQE